MLCTLGAGLIAAVILPGSQDDEPRFDARRVRLQPLARAALLSAMEGARERLEGTACAALLDEYEAEDGMTLRRRLEEHGVSAPDYLARVVFVDGHGDAPCRRRDVYAFTSLGSRVVRVCPDRFRALARQEPRRAEAVVIHEVLHTLGLGENPPSPPEITARVLVRCAP